MIVLNASVTSLPASVTGLSSLPLTTSAFQPGSGLVRTEVSGVSCGRVTSIFVVPALSRSFGTRNANVARPPWVNSDGWALTCADATVGGAEDGDSGNGENGERAHAKSICRHEVMAPDCQGDVRGLRVIRSHRAARAARSHA